MTTCTTPFVKGKIVVIVKAKSVGATKQKLRQLNALDSRWLLVVRNKSGVMSGQFYHRYLYPHGIRPMFRAVRERFRQHKRLRSMVPPSAVLLEDACRAHSQAAEWKTENEAAENTHTQKNTNKENKNKK